MRKFFKEFKDFISKGNVFDMAVGLIVATAFNKIVSSMVNDIIMPLVTWATGAASLADLSIPLKYNELGEVTLRWAYGNFIQTVIDFLIIAFSVFLMVKAVNASRRGIQELGETIATQTKREYKQERKQVKILAKQQNRPFNVVWAEHEEAKRIELEAKAKVEAEEKARKELEEKLNNPTEKELLKEIRDLLKSQSKKK